MTTITCGIYARFSTDMQRPTSIDDQIRICKQYAESNGWTVRKEHIYVDMAKSGTSMIPRTGLNKLLSSASEKPAPFQHVIVDDTSRLARSLREALTMIADLQFKGIQVHFVSQQINTLQPNFQIMITMYGLFDELFSKELASKVRRGMEGQVLRGYNAGSIPYGYISKQIYSEENDRSGSKKAKGCKLYINPEEADVVKLIFKKFGEEKWSVRDIVDYLNDLINKKGMPCPPYGKRWSVSTIYGKKKEGIGILNNEVYIGRRIWNRRKYKKDPKTGRKKETFNPPSEWVITELPELRIIDDVLWDKVKKRQRTMHYDPEAPRKTPSANFLTPVSKCGQCGGSFCVVRGGIYGEYGCSTNWNKGYSECPISVGFKKNILENKIIEGLCEKLSISISESLFSLHSEMCEKIKSYFKTATNGKQKHELESELIIAREEHLNISNNLKAGYISDTTYKLLLDVEKKIKDLNNQLALATAQNVDDIDIATSFTLSDLTNYFEKLLKRLTDPQSYKSAFYTFISKVVINYEKPYTVYADLYENTDELNEMIIRILNEKVTRMPIESGTRFSFYTTRIYNIKIDFPPEGVRLSSYHCSKK